MKTYLLIIRKAVLIGSVFLLFFATGAVGGTYYVATTGSDTNPGTEASPWVNIQKAADTVVAGDTVIVKDGTYTDSNDYGGIRNCVVIIKKRNGTPTNWITFRAENTHGAVLDGENSLSTGFYLYQSNYIRIEGFEIKKFGGIHINNSHDTYIYKCKIHDIGRHYTSSTCDGYKIGFAGISSTDTVYNSTVDSCVFYNIGRQHQDRLCRDDYVYDQMLYAQGKNWLIKNNIFYNATSGWALKLDGHDGATSEPTHKVINNTFAHQPNVGYVTGIYTRAQGHILINQSHGDYRPHDVIIENNVSYDPPGTSMVYPTVHIGDAIMRNNVTSASRMYNSGYGTPTVANNTTGLPLADFGMTDPENNDFTLKASASYLINRGIATFAIDKDYTGIARPQDGTYDIGAYEYIPQGQLLTAPQNLKLLGP